MEIKRTDGTVAYTSEKATLREAVIEAVAARANLAGANLARAYLAGAHLVGAHLAGAKTNAGTVSTWLASGALADYPWYAYRSKEGPIVLRYGCEEMALSAWKNDLHDLCAEHVLGHVTQYESLLTALFAFVEASDAALTPKPEEAAEPQKG